jgi:hypothetical protein
MARKLLLEAATIKTMLQSLWHVNTMTTPQLMMSQMGMT